MAHVRQQIRSAIAVLLNNISSNPSVHQSRVYDLESGDLPAIKLYTAQEPEISTPEILSTPRLLAREMRISIEACIKKVLRLDDELDDMCVEIEESLSADLTLNGLTHDLWLESTEIELNDGGEQPHGIARMTWVAKYYVYENDLETAIL